MTERGTSPDTAYHRLTAAETEQLKRQGCTADSWQQIEIATDTDLQYVENVHFRGTVRIGAFRKSYTLPGGVTLHSGVRHAVLQDVCIGDDCLIEDIRGYIARYDIGPQCVIMHTDLLAMTGRSAFGNGTALSVMSESGGREIVMHDRLSAQEAYLQAMHRHNAAFTLHLQEAARRYAGRQTSDRGSIGEGTYILYCGRLTDIKTGPAAHLEGVARLGNGTVCSHPAAPTFIGEGVIARDFIVQSGCHVTDGAMLTRCHVGQASVIGHGFTASDTYFACNCQAENGEACAVLAGPYTVTHHKSTLLIGGMFSFMNAGSATNQSNHAYKLGPMHHGILERGCKTASGTHLSWPVRIGAFSLVTGHCDPQADSHAFPFSYIVEHNRLIPGIALRNIGTLRDMLKWPERDGRASEAPHTDHLVFEAFSPYVMEQVMKACALLTGWEKQTDGNEGDIAWNGLHISRKHISRGRELYRLAIDRFFGEQFIRRLESLDGPLPNDLYGALRPAKPCGRHWCDIGGLVAPKNEIEQLETDVAEKRLSNPDALDERFRIILENYERQAWAWTWQQLMEAYPETTPDNFIRHLCLPVIRRWCTAACSLNRQIIADALKEFATPPPCVFGIDADDEQTRLADAEAVRGMAETHPLIQSLEKAQTDIREKAACWQHRLGNLSHSRTD